MLIDAADPSKKEEEIGLQQKRRKRRKKKRRKKKRRKKKRRKKKKEELIAYHLGPRKVSDFGLPRSTWSTNFPRPKTPFT